MHAAGTLPRRAIALALLAVLATAAAPALAQDPAPTDSTYVPRYTFTPVFTNKINADVSSIGMLNEFNTGFKTPWGSFFTFRVSGEEKNYRLTPQFEEKKLMSVSDLHTFDLLWFGSASFSDSRVLNRSKTVGGGFTDFIINDQTATLGSTWRRAYGDLRADVQGSGGLITSERTFKNDKGIQSGVNGGVAYSIGDRIVVQGRGALRGTWDESTTTDSLFTNLGSAEDSLSTGITFQLLDSTSFDATHRRYEGDRTFADQGRGSLGVQQGGAENVFEENEGRSTRNTMLSMKSKIARRFFISLNAQHDEQTLDYREQETRDSKTVGDLVSGNISYVMPWKTTTSLQFETGETLRDFGPLSTASFTDKRQRVALTLAHSFTKTFSLSFNGSSQLTQSFYVDYEESPLDRDQVDTSLNLRITSSYFKKLSAGIGIAYTNSEFVNIDSLQSSDNRTRELWELRPTLTFFLRPNMSIIQIYGLSFDYTDYHFQEDQNFLDRNLTFTNEFRYKPTKKINFLFEYSLYLHDSGSYLPDEETGERLYEVASEDRRDRTRLRVDYRVKEKVVDNRIAASISFFAENLYSQFEEWTPGLYEEREVTTDGQIQVGTQVNYDWGGGRKLLFFVSKVKRFSPFGVEAAKDYWDARSEISYAF